MNGIDTTARGKPSAATRAEAAAWIARLHGPNRDARVEKACRQWLAGSPERAAAFELLTDTWEKAGQLNLPADLLDGRSEPQARFNAPRAALAACVIAAVAVAATLLYLRDEGLQTGIGEQRTLTLEDGSRVYLNTNSRAVVHFDRQKRSVELTKGEALFEVAPNPTRPFIVTAAGREVRALGTAFVVRNEPRQVAVMLVEGSVVVSPEASAAGQPAQRPRSTEALTLDPGERVTFAGGQPARIDRPPLEKITAWRHGQVSLDNTTLADTVSEMNRYSAVPLVILDPNVAAIRLSGVFRAGDTQNFIAAVSKTYHLRARDDGSEIILELETRP